jgi:hypothetical protein
MPTITPNPAYRAGRNLPDGYMTVAEFSRSLGLRGGGLYRELGRYGIRTKRIGKYRAISVENAQKYITLTELPHIKRVTKRPSGWLNTARTADVIGCSTCTVDRLARQKAFRAVRVGYTRYFHPADVEQVRLEYNNFPLPHWYAVVDTAQIYNADVNTAIRWLRRHFELRKYRRPETKQLIMYAEQKSLEHWVGHYAQWWKDVGSQPTIGEQIMQLVAQHPMTLDDLNTHIDSTRESIKNTANRMARDGIISKDTSDIRKPRYQAAVSAQKAA